MRHALDLSPIGAWGDPRTLADLALQAERVGWDGVFLEDYVFHPGGLAAYDPWIALAAIALATERIRLGTLITPVPRRRPWKLAAEVMTIDQLSGGRMTLGVGSGDPQSPDNRATGEVADPRERAARLDAGLEIVDALLRGDEAPGGLTLRPHSVQRPRVPIWIGGALTRRGPRARALRWDGSCLYRVPPPDWEDLTPADVEALRADAPAGFDIVVGGRRRRADEDAERDYVRAIEAAGATWWHEWLPPQASLDEVRAHVGRGPLR